MEKRAVVTVVCLVLLIVVVGFFLVGCTDDAAAPAKPLATQEYVDTQIAAAKSGITEGLATKEYVNEKFNSLPTSTSYSRGELDSKIAELKAELKAEIAAAGSSNSNSPSTGSTTDEDQLVDSNKDLKLYLTDVNPANDPLQLGKSTDIRFEFTVENTHSTNSRNFEVTIVLYPDEDETVAATTDVDIFSDNIDMTATITPASGLVEDGDPLTIKCVEGWVGKNDTQDFAVILSLDVNESAEWDYNIDIRQTN